MKHAPWVAAIRDISDFGRCSTTMVLPILAAMSGECCLLLTAYLSAHTAFPTSEKTTFLDLTGQVAGTTAHWAELGVTFDVIYSGFPGSAGQIGLIGDSYRQFRQEGILVLVDPAIGDHGKPYHTYAPELCGRMRDLAAQVSVIIPNLTGAALLLEKNYADLPRDEGGLRARLEQLSLDGRCSVVLIGASLRPGIIGASCFDRATGRIRFAMAGQEPAQFPGTSDFFANVVPGAILRRGPLEITARRAAELVQRCAAHTLASNTPVLEGVQFEPLLGELIQR